MNGAVTAATETLSPAVIESIEAELMLTIYRARRLARLQLLGREPAPAASPEALELLRRVPRGTSTV
jgi:hypothetical protein